MAGKSEMHGSVNSANQMASSRWPTRECWPAGTRDWLLSHCAVRFGRIDKFPAVRGARKALLSLIGHDYSTVRFKTPYGLEILHPGWDSDFVIAALNGRIHHPRMTEIFLAVIKPGDTFVDAGANTGFYSLLAATKLSGKGHVVSFEPDPRNLPILRSNVELNRLSTLIHIEPKALSDEECDLDFWGAPYNTWGGSLVELPGKRSRQFRVSATTLDRYVVAANLERVDIIKIDIEGAEPLALQGMGQALRTARLVVYEINKPRLDQLAIQPLDLIRRTNKQGQFDITLVSDERTDEIVALEDARSMEIFNTYGWANIVSAKGDAVEPLREMFGI